MVNLMTKAEMERMFDKDGMGAAAICKIKYERIKEAIEINQDVDFEDIRASTCALCYKHDMKCEECGIVYETELSCDAYNNSHWGELRNALEDYNDEDQECKSEKYDKLIKSIDSMIELMNTILKNNSDNNGSSNKCCVCEKYIHKENIIYFDNDPYCEECYNEKVAYCEECGGEYLRDDMYSHDDNLYCDRCYHEKYTDCAGCGEEIEYSEACEEDGEHFCADCHAEQFEKEEEETEDKKEEEEENPILN